jgi:hypothetical protein
MMMTLAVIMSGIVCGQKTSEPTLYPVNSTGPALVIDMPTTVNTTHLSDMPMPMMMYMMPMTFWQGN